MLEGESGTFLEAINTGHGGSFTTIHADSARKAIDRLAIMVMASGLGMGFEEVKRYCAASIDVVVQLSRQGGVGGWRKLGCLGRMLGLPKSGAGRTQIRAESCLPSQPRIGIPQW